MKKKVMLMFLAGLLILAVALSACRTSTTVQTTWFRDPNGYFHTNNLERAEQEAKFTIILPEYLPSGIDAKSLIIVGLYKDNPLGGTEIRIQYVNYQEGPEISISEQNIIFDWSPNPEAQPTYINVAKTRVLREKTTLLTGEGTKEGIMYSWHQDKVTITLKIFSLLEEEGLKIVESMIQQMK